MSLLSEVRTAPEAAISQAVRALLGTPDLTVTVRGSVPAPQGSKTNVRDKDGGLLMRATKNGRAVPVMRESSSKVAPWRRDVAAAATHAARARGRTGPLEGPVWMDVVFTMPRPVATPKTRRSRPTTMPDLSKLVRSTEDALDTDAGVLTDDSQIVTTLSREVYAGDPHDPDALTVPGAVIRLWALTVHTPPGFSWVGR